MSKADSSAADPAGFGPELEALGAVLKALNPLGDEARAFIFRTAAERLKIAAPSAGWERSKLAGRPPAESGGSGNDSLEDVEAKEFLRLKKPVTELQRMACLGYYLTHARQTPHFNTADLTALNTEAAGAKFSNPSATVRNATNQSHLFAPAGKGGAKQITALCEDFVRALPDQEGAKAAILSHKPQRRRAAKKKRARKE